MDQHEQNTHTSNFDGRTSGLRVELFAEMLRVFRADSANPILTQHARRNRRPFIHPILAPDAVGEVTEDGTDSHHSWQHGLFIGLNDVNGVRFWMEEKGVDGTFHPKPLMAQIHDERSVAWVVNSEWRSPQGAPMVAETQGWLFRDEGTEFILDLSWTLRALVDIVFGQYAYGGLYLRSPYRPDSGARVLNSKGEINLDADGQRARWAAVEQPIPGREQCREPVCTVAILDHPSNPEHPTPWRTDRHMGVAPSRCIAGTWRLGRGESTRSRYRLLIRFGKADRERIEATWRAFAGE